MAMRTLVVALLMGLLLGGTAQGADSPEDMFWKSVKKSDVLEEYRVYVEQYPKGKYAFEAWRRIGQLEAEEKSALAARREDEARRQAAAEVLRREQAAKDVAIWPKGQESGGNCEATAVSSEGRPLVGAARAAFVRKCEFAIERKTAESELRPGKAFKEMEAQELAQPQAKMAKKAKKAKKAGAEVADADALRPGSVFKDCTECPEMVVIPAGSFEMGSPPSEVGRDGHEGPQHPVTIRQAFALAKYEVTVAEFRAFVRAANYRTDAEKNAFGKDGCYARDPSEGKFDWRKGFYWDNPGFAQSERHPAACISWNDAQAYANWLSNRTGKKYRLPAESEWEYAARAGTTSSRFWGDNLDLACNYANVNDKKFGCSDGHLFTAPVGSYVPNAFGLHDMAGNVWEWTEDCSNESYHGAPGNGSAWDGGDCSVRVQRGGSWSGTLFDQRSANRGRYRTGNRGSWDGFRVAKTLF